MVSVEFDTVPCSYDVFDDEEFFGGGSKDERSASQSGQQEGGGGSGGGQAAAQGQGQTNGAQQHGQSGFVTAAEHQKAQVRRRAARWCGLEQPSSQAIVFLVSAPASSVHSSSADKRADYSVYSIACTAPGAAGPLVWCSKQVPWQLIVSLSCEVPFRYLAHSTVSVE